MSAASNYVSVEFRDFDAFAEAVEDAEFTFRCSSLQENHWSLDGIRLPGGINVQMVSEGGGNIADGVNPADGGNIFMHRDGLMRVNGKELNASSPFFMPPRSEFVFSNDRSHRWFSIYIPESLMHEIGLNEDAQGREYRRVSVLRSTLDQSNRIWWLGKRFLSSVEANPHLSGSPAALESFRDELVGTLRDFYGRKLELRTPGRGRPAVTDRLTIARAIDAVEASPDGKLSLAELVSCAGVSERSLRAAFGRYLGVSPSNFMLIRSLNRARKRFALAQPEETTVTQVAADLGYWDVGRFATRYRKIFGETPSATLRSSVKRRR